MNNVSHVLNDTAPASETFENNDISALHSGSKGLSIDTARSNSQSSFLSKVSSSAPGSNLVKFLFEI